MSYPKRIITPQVPRSVDDVKMVEKYFEDPNYLIEPALPGVRHIIYIMQETGVAFLATNLVEGTNRYVDNTVRVPHITREIDNWQKDYQSQYGEPLKDTILDCELLYGESKKDITDLLAMDVRTSINTQIEHGRIEAFVSDVIKYDNTDMTQKPLAKRRALLERIAQKLRWPVSGKWDGRMSHRIVLVPLIDPHLTWQEILDAGYPGVILKNAHAPYQAGYLTDSQVKILIKK